MDQPPKSPGEGAPAPAWEDVPAAVLAVDGDGRVRRWNGAARDLLETPPGAVVDLVRHGLLDRPLDTMKRIKMAAPRREVLPLRLHSWRGRRREVLATPGAGPAGTLVLTLLPGGDQAARERALRREIIRLEGLLAAPPEAGDRGPWRETARGLLELLPGRSVLLDRNLKVVFPRQGEAGPPVLCEVHLLGSPGPCRRCVAARARDENREVGAEIDGVRLRARPLPGGFILEWREE
jgi:hypothetical protein